MLKRSLDRARLLRPHGNRASLQRHSNAQVALVRTPDTHQSSLPAPAEPVGQTNTVASTKQWRRRRNTH